MRNSQTVDSPSLVPIKLPSAVYVALTIASVTFFELFLGSRGQLIL